MPATATVTGLEFIILPSQDLKRATAFYQDVLGLEIDSKWREMGVEFELVDASVKDLQAKGVEFRAP